MIIEYIGSLIRNEVANKRERIYENSVSIYVASSLLIVNVCYKILIHL